MDRIFRVLLAGIAAGFILFLASSIVYNITGEISDPSLKQIFRKTVSMAWFYKLLLINVGTGLIMALFYALLGRGLSGGAVVKGLVWGFVVWAVMVHQHLIFRLVTGYFTTELFLSWALQGLVSYMAAGIAVTLITRD
ncbi:MAG TPA: hypothetical protein VKS21_11885 [Spirochaetota bacterium]|nr:hypothetical protein [Spirochaetota bacterium]